MTTLADVVEVLRRGQVAELLFTEDAAGRPAALDERQVWTGAGPLDIALRRSELAALGVPSGEARQMRADIAVLRAATAQDAGFTFALEGSVDLVDGVGALLRWSDQATPHEAAPELHQGPQAAGPPLRQALSGALRGSRSPYAAVTARTGPRSPRRSP